MARTGAIDVIDAIHVVTWLATIIFMASISTPSLVLGTGGDLDAGKAILNLLLLQHWVPRVDYIASINSVSWSISCEAFFYALFPLLFIALKRIPAHHLWRWFALTAALIVIVPGPTYLIHGPSADEWVTMPILQLWLVYAFPPTRLLEFALGIMAARRVQTGRWPRLPLWPPLLIGGLIFMLTPVLPTAYLFGAALAVPMATIVPALANRDLAGKTGWLGHPVMILLGNASYALYLAHYPVLRIFRHLIGPQQRFAWWSGTLLAVVAIALSILVAVLIYTYIEAPIVRRYSRRQPQHTGGVGHGSHSEWERNQDGLGHRG